MHCSTEQNAFDNIKRISVEKEETSTSFERDSMYELTMSPQANTGFENRREQKKCVFITYIDLKPSFDDSDNTEDLGQQEDPLYGVGHDEYDQNSFEVNEECANDQFFLETEAVGSTDLVGEKQVPRRSPGKVLSAPMRRVSSPFTEVNSLP